LGLDVKTLPADCAPYRRTATFANATIPAGLLKGHRTKPGVWGRIVVLRGELLFRILEPRIEEIILEPDVHGIVEPGIAHEIAPVGDVAFYVEFCRQGE
jgi:tellurite resistance-related uncharacterized protein